MARGRVIENLGNGQYRVEIFRNLSTADNRIAELNAEISEIETEISIAHKAEIPMLKLRKAAIEKELQRYSQIKNRVVLAWTADYETDLTGIVGVANIPDEPDRNVTIQPGGKYNASRDGDVFPILAMAPETAYFNRAILPGVQRWRPRFRYGRIVLVDYAADTCSVALAPAYSSQQGLSVNPGENNSITSHGPGVAPYGWESFRERYQGHPIVENSSTGSPLSLSPEKLRQLQEVNARVNAEHAYEHDKGNDIWNILAPGQPGDCEDLVLTKMDILISMGWNVSDLYLTGCVVMQADGELVGHGVLQIDTDQGTLVLDNRFPDVMSITDPRVSNYSWTSRLDAGGWEVIASSIILENVPIDYMWCDSSAFSVGDWALLSFDGSWDTPRVIGFPFAPKECPNSAINITKFSPDLKPVAAVVDSEFNTVIEISNEVYTGGAALCPTPMATDPETGKIDYKNLLWTTGGAGTGWSGRDYRMGDEVEFRGYDIETGSRVKSFNCKAMISSGDVEYPVRPSKIVPGMGGLWGIFGIEEDSHIWGIIYHSVHTGEGRWVKSGSTVGGIYPVGLDIWQDRLFMAARGAGLFSWEVTSAGFVAETERSRDIGSGLADIKIFGGEIYVLCFEGRESDLPQWVKIFDPDFNELRSFHLSPTLSSCHYGGSISIIGGLVYVGIENDVVVYTREGEFVRQFKVGGRINSIV